MNTRIFRQGSKDAAFHIARTEQKPEAVAQQRIVYAMAQLQK